MPRFSIVVPVYNIEKYICRCIESIQAQNYVDYEVILVDDASEDSSASVIEKAIAGDKRFTLLVNSANQGLHLTRKIGVRASTGEYLIFVDGDDELSSPEVLTQLEKALNSSSVDILRFGLRAIPENGMPKNTAEHFQIWANENRGYANRQELLSDMFTLKGGYRYAWNMTHRVFKGPLIRNAFSLMTNSRLDRAEDAYELFITVDQANGEQYQDILGYDYHIGLGVTGTIKISLTRFILEAKQIKNCYEKMIEYANKRHDSFLESAALDTKEKLLESVGNTLVERVSATDFLEAAKTFRSIVGDAEAGNELWRFVRDRAYQFISDGQLPSNDDVLNLYLAAANEVKTSDAIDSHFINYMRMKHIAESHIEQLNGAKRLEECRKERVKIFITSHKRVDIPKDPCFQLVQVGQDLTRPNGRFIDSFHDDDGDDNISDRNPMYCEMTVQYWAWKNALEDSDYVGFCHYRRYFNFSENTYPENPYGEIIDTYIDDKSIKKYGLDRKHIERAINGYDLITTGFHSLAAIPGDFTTPQEHYEAAPLLHKKDLSTIINILIDKHPDYERDAREFLNSHKACFCNMYIMRTALFSEYCEWLFPILEQFMHECDMSLYSKEALRTPGHLAERLFNIYYRHLIRTNKNLKTKQLQCVHFESPDKQYPIEPIVFSHPEAIKMGIIPVVFASDSAYVPMLTTTIVSMLANADPTRFYDIIILERNIGGEKRELIKSAVSQYKNASIRFHNVSRMISGYDLTTNNQHISMETYYRFLVQEILDCYDKVLYLDSDLIVKGNIRELYDIELGDNLLAAAHDIDYLGNLNMNDGKRLTYTTQTLKLKKPYNYFQAGVLLLNTRALRKLHTVSEWMDIVTRANYIYDDQDILNTECQDRVVFLPFEWNVMHDCGGRIDSVFKFAPNEIYDAYMASRVNPKIIHYAGWEKPWVNPECDYAPEYWQYARKTPFYEMLIAKLAKNSVTGQATNTMPIHEKAVSPTNPLRKIIDPIAPYGTARREVLKSIGRAVQGKK